MLSSEITAFNVYWWVDDDGPRLYHLATRSPADIEVSSNGETRVCVYPLTADDGVPVEFILRESNSRWTLICNSFYGDLKEYPMTFATTDDGSVWTDALDGRQIVIRGKSKK